MRQDLVGSLISAPAVNQANRPEAASRTALAEDLEVRSAALARLSARADEQEHHVRSETTYRCYDSDLRHFKEFCGRYQLTALPATADTVRLYLAEMATTVKVDGRYAFSPATIARRLAAINYAHKAAGLPGFARHERVGAVLAGIRRERTTRQRQMRPLLLDDVSAAIAAMDFTTWPDSVAAIRDRFVLLAGFAGALRRSEVAGLSVGQVTYHRDDGLHVRLDRSKTDQEARGATIALPFGRHPLTCPPCAWTRWMEVLQASQEGGRPGVMRVALSPFSDPEEHICRTPQSWVVDPGSPLVLAVRRGGHLGDTAITGHALHNMVKRRAAAASLGHTDLGFHSLRAGFVTQARRNGADTRAIRLQTRHGSDKMVEVYDREYVPLAGGNAVLQLGL